MDDRGIPPTPEGRVAIAARIRDRAAQIGIPAEDVIIDSLVLTVGADGGAAGVTLATIELVRRELGLNLLVGASSASFGLPDRPTINEFFLALALHSGASCVITDPTKLTATDRATDLLLGRDPHAGRFIALIRSRPREGRPAGSRSRGWIRGSAGKALPRRRSLPGPSALPSGSLT